MSAYVCFLHMFEGGGGGGVFLGPSCFSLSPPPGQLTQQVFSGKEELVEFGPLYGKLERIPSGFIKIMQNDSAEAFHQRYVEKQGKERDKAGWRYEGTSCQSLPAFL